jgi:hypothetical protein
MFLKKRAINTLPVASVDAQSLFFIKRFKYENLLQLNNDIDQPSKEK